MKKWSYFVAFPAVFTVLLLASLFSQQSANPGFNVATVGDFGCTPDSKETASNIQSKDPQLVMLLGDLSYNESGECWYQIIAPFESISKIAFGNHDEGEEGSSALKEQYLDHFGLSKPYYSFDFQNLHVLVMDTQTDYSRDSDQYEFVKRDLELAGKSSQIDWIGRKSLVRRR